jgi:DNA-binding response OmpR family regulator
VRISAEARGQEIVLAVSDAGPGIPRDKWDQIFDRFSQLADPDVSEIDGFGLGLYIVKRIVEYHGGAAWVDSEVGKGSVFFVSLPLKAKNAKSESNGLPIARAGTVLVCDPDPELAASIARTLSERNYETRVCHSGRRLLAQLDHGDLDVVITDVLLPDMNSAEVLDALAGSAGRTFRVIVHSFADDSAEFGHHGVNVFLQRPVSADELVHAVELALNGQGGDAGTVLLVDTAKTGVSALAESISDAGYTVLSPDCVRAAEILMRDSALDNVFVADGALDGDWAILDGWRATSQRPLSVIVLSECPRTRERRLADEFGVTLLTSQPDNPHEVLTAISAARPALALEPSS